MISTLYSNKTASFSCVRIRRRISMTVAILLTMLSVPSVSAAESVSDKWESRIAVYLWMAGMNGNTGNHLKSGSVDADFGDILDNLEAGFMANYRGKKGRWGMGLDVIYLNLGPDATVTGPNPSPIGPSILSASADVDVKQWIVDLTASYEALPGLDLLAGARYVDLDVKSKVELSVPAQKSLKISGSENWIDPIVGAEYRGRIAKSNKWHYILHGDIGGFGVGSDLTWQAYGYVGYQPAKQWHIYGGIRYLSIDYDSDNSRGFFYDTNIGGPVLGVGYSF